MKNTILLLLVMSNQLLANDINFAKDIKPILSDRCFDCHGPDGGDYGEKWKGGLRLDQKEYAFADLNKIKQQARNAKLKAEGKEIDTSMKESRFALIEGKPDQSLLLERIFTTDPDEIMPPSDSHKSLNDKEKALIKKWIEQGANWDEHWSFIAPTKPKLPKVIQTNWAQQDLDYFILNTLEDKTITPAPRAEPLTLLRRLALSLTGLPASAKHIEDVKKNGYNALNNIVDTLLESRSFAERMTVEWLDLARYADTLDFQYDQNRDAWPYKEWVIRSFEANKPFDQFITEQLAGDLLPNATQDQKLATAFNRLHGISTEGGIIQEEYRVQYVNDRVQTFATTFLGLTFDCTKCHNHKYDPLTQEDYYSMSAFFSNIKEYSQDSKSYGSMGGKLNYSITDPKLLESYEQEMTKATSAVLALNKVNAEDFEQWKKSLNKSDFGHQLLTSSANKTIGYRPYHFDHEKHKRILSVTTANIPIVQSLDFKLKLSDTTEKKTLQIDQLSLTHIDTKGNRKNIALKLFDESPRPKKSSATNISATDKKNWSIELEPSKEFSSLFSISPLTLHAGDNLELTIVVDNLISDHVFIQCHAYSENSDLILAHRKNPNHVLSQLLQPEQLNYYQTFYPDLPEVQRAVSTIQNVAQERARAVGMLVMEERAENETQKNFILIGGSYDHRGKEVTANTPKFLPSLNDFPKNRLGLAKWLFTPQQPLFSRVMVNRVWQMLFGMGIVKTSGDFGAQGEQPSHPELLDHLAVEFRASNWNLNALIKKIVTSATFQQSSKERPELEDPENRLLARGPRFRLNAEFIRDQVLSLSGLLTPSEKASAPVYPYQPDGLWSDLTNRSGYKMIYSQSHGPDLYRRSVYGYWKRAQPNPSFMAFDAPKRDVCSTKRSNTNTPIQALVIWHDPTYIEASRAFAQEIYLVEGKTTLAEKLNYLYQKSFHRSMQKREATLMQAYFETLLSHYRTQPEKVQSILKVGALDQSKIADPAWVAAFSSVCLALFNTSEFITLQ